MKNIFVGNLNYTATEDEIRSLFEQFGTVDRVSLITDRDTGRPRGFAFCEMPNDEEGAKAIEELNGAMLGGRQLNINEARPRAAAGGGGGGGGFRGQGGGGGGGDRGGRRREPRW